MKETLKLNEEESASLNVDCDGHKVMQKYLSSSNVLDFEENDVLDDTCQEIMDMHCQDAFDTECKRIELKFKLNSIDDNECNAIDYGHLKKTCNAMMSHGKEVVTPCPSEKKCTKN